MKNFFQLEQNDQCKVHVKQLTKIIVFKNIADKIKISFISHMLHKNNLFTYFTSTLKETFSTALS